MLAICLDYCHSLLFWEGNDDVPSAYVQAVAHRQGDFFLTMLYNDEVHTYQQVTDALQVARFVIDSLCKQRRHTRWHQDESFVHLPS